MGRNECPCNRAWCISRTASGCPRFTNHRYLYHEKSRRVRMLVCFTKLFTLSSVSTNHENALTILLYRRRRKSVVTGINISNQPVWGKPSTAENHHDKSKVSTELQLNRENTKSPLPPWRQMEFCESQDIDFFWEPSPYPKYNVPPLNHCMTPREDKEHNSVSIISLD